MTFLSTVTQIIVASAIVGGLTLVRAEPEQHQRQASENAFTSASGQGQQRLAQATDSPAPADKPAASEAKPAASDAKPAPSGFDVRGKFQQVCGLCHQDYGRQAGYGPKLMDSPNPDNFLFDRIKKGKPGRMAAFGGMLTDDQIQEMVAFIRRLKPNEEPK